MHDTEPISLLTTVEQQHSRRVGRYIMYRELAVGGAGSIHVGRVAGPGGFVRVVAIKRLHPHLVRDKERVAAFLDEARIASRIHHLNVATPLDVIVEGDEPFMVMEYIDGVTLAELLKLSFPEPWSVPVGVIASIMVDVLRGLHAAHTAQSERGEPLKVVHRDVSPSNIMVGCDGIARILDFGIAKAQSRTTITGEDNLKGKLGYMAPEQIAGGGVDCRADIFAAGVVFWEALTKCRLFQAETEAEAAGKTVTMIIPSPSSRNSEISEELDEVILRALCREAEDRYQSAEEFAQAIERAQEIATARSVGKWVLGTGASVLEGRRKLLEEIERSLDDCERLPEEEGIVPSRPPFATTTLQSTALTLPPTSTKRPNAKSRTWLVAGALAVAFAAGGVFLSGSRHSERQSSTAAVVYADEPSVALEARGEPSSAAAPKSAPTAALPSAAREMELAPTATPAASAEPAVEVVEPARKQPKARGSKRQRQHSRTQSKPQKSATRRVSRSNCSPPFTIDRHGIRRIKPHCL